MRSPWRHAATSTTTSLGIGRDLTYLGSAESHSGEVINQPCFTLVLVSGPQDCCLSAHDPSG